MVHARLAHFLEGSGEELRPEGAASFVLAIMCLALCLFHPMFPLRMLAQKAWTHLGLAAPQGRDQGQLFE